MKKMRRNRNQQGFSLVELLVALSILTIGLLATVTMQGMALTANSTANKNSTSTAISEQIMDDLMSTDVRIGTPGYTTFTTNGTTFAYNRFPPYNGSNATIITYSVPGVGTYRADYTIRTNWPAQNISEVSLQVYITDSRGVEKKVPMTLVGHKLIPTTN